MLKTSNYNAISIKSIDNNSLKPSSHIYLIEIISDSVDYEIASYTGVPRWCYRGSIRIGKIFSQSLYHFIHDAEETQCAYVIHDSIAKIFHSIDKVCLSQESHYCALNKWPGIDLIETNQKKHTQTHAAAVVRIYSCRDVVLFLSSRAEEKTKNKPGHYD